MSSPSYPTRRQTLATAMLLFAAPLLRAADEPAESAAEPIIDIHQHTNYSGRTDEQLLFHQKRMGVTQTILLPAGTPVNMPSTHDGKTNGLAAQCGSNDTCVNIAREHPGVYFFFANEVPDLPTARQTIEKYLKLGALGIGEQKFFVPCDSPPIELVAEIAGEHNVPVLMHFEEGMFNVGFANFHKILEKFPKTRFIGHAQSFWANIDSTYDPSQGKYPKGKVTRGGYTERYLAEYPNMYADISAGSGLNSLQRDEEHARWFLEKFADKILFGSDCNDAVGRGPTCQGWLTIQTIKRLAASKQVERKILYENAKNMFSLKPKE
jgi:uncharacterized protein